MPALEGIALSPLSKAPRGNALPAFFFRVTSATMGHQLHMILDFPPTKWGPLRLSWTVQTGVRVSGEEGTILLHTLYPKEARI